MASALDQLASLDVAASIDPVIISADPEVRRGSTTAFQVRDASGVSGAFRFVVDTTNKRWGFSAIDGAFTPGTTWDGEIEGGDFFMRATVYSNTPDDEVEWVARKARGTKAAPAALMSGDCILEWEVNGYNGAGFTGEQGNLVFRASENWAPGSEGTEFLLRLTQNGTGGVFDALLVENDGTLDIQAGGLDIGSVAVFEADRDLAIDLIPNADASLDVGSPARRFAEIIGNQHDVYAGAGEANPSARLQTAALLFGPGGGTALDSRYRRAGTSLTIFDDGGGTTRPWIIDAANNRIGQSLIDDLFVPAVDWDFEKQSSEYELRWTHYGVGNVHWIGRSANGTKAAPVALADDDDMMEISGQGYDGAAFSGDQATLLLEADGAWTGISHGTKWTVKTTPSGSTAIQDSLEVRGDGDTNIITGDLEIGGTVVFENDRDLAIDLIPNADDTLDLGSVTRRFTQAFIRRLLLQGTTTDIYIESADGSTAGVSGAATGRIRYNNGTGRWEVSTQGGAYENISVLSDDAFVQGGNSFGAVAILGTNDAFDLELEAGGTSRVRIDDATGDMDLLTGGFAIGGTTVFESDRDLAVNLIPNADGTLDVGSTTRHFDQGFFDQVVYQRHLLYADQLDNPVTADWAVNALAPAAADSNNDGLTVRLFDDTTEEGVGFIFSVPTDATEVVISLKSRAETAPGAAVAAVPRIYLREIPDDGAVGAWSAGTDLAAISIPTNENFQYDSETFTIGALGITAGRLYQFELTRNVAAGGDTLVGDWDLLELVVEFR